MEKNLYIIAGCNGAGKTAASFAILPEIEHHKAEIHKLCLAHKVRSLYVLDSILTDKFNNEGDIDLIVDFNDMVVEDYADNYFDFKFSLQEIFEQPIILLEDKAITNPYFRETINQRKQLLFPIKQKLVKEH